MDHESIAQLLGNYGEFIGAIGVVITLAYLAVQIRQNTRALRAASIDSMTQIANDIRAIFKPKWTAYFGFDCRGLRVVR